MARIDDARTFLNDPSRVKFYTVEERRERAKDRRQTDAEFKAARRLGLKGSALFEYRIVPEDLDISAEVKRLARRYASTSHCRTVVDPHEHDAYRADLLLAKWKREGKAP